MRARHVVVAAVLAAVLAAALAAAAAPVPAQALKMPKVEPSLNCLRR